MEDSVMEGYVISLGDTPNTLEFYFSFRGNLEKHSFVEVGGRIARVDEVFSANKLLQDPSEAEFFSSGNALMDIEGLNVKYAKATMVKAGEPPMPGEAVKLASSDMVERAIGLDLKEGLHIGKMQSHGLEVKLPLTKLFKKHLSVLAMSGAGKSYFVSVLLEELLRREKSPAIVVLDIHGEYSRCFSDMGEVIDADKDISVAAKDVDVGMLRELFPNITEAQEGLLYKTLGSFFSETDKSPESLLKSLEKSAKSSQEKATLNATQRKLEKLINGGVLRTYTQPELSRELEPGKLLILDFSRLADSTIASFKIYFIVKRLFDLRMEGKIPPTIIFVEEAHNIAPEKRQKRDSAGKELIERVAREGRKFGLSLVLITQRPAHLSQTALSQCNTQVFFRITNPNDLDYIKRVSESINESVVKSLPSLDVGQAFITGEAVKTPIFVNVRKLDRECKDRDLSLEEMVEEYLRVKQSSRKEAIELL